MVTLSGQVSLVNSIEIAMFISKLQHRVVFDLSNVLKNRRVIK